jgi:Tol biopolymer transport system component
MMLRSTGAAESQDITPTSLEPRWDVIRWSPDGRSVLISGAEPESGREGFFAYTLATGEIEHVFSPADYTSESARVFLESFSRDWETAYLPMSDGPPGTEGPQGPYSLLRVDIADNTTRELLTLPARTRPGARPPFGLFVPSPDGLLLAFWEITEPDTVRLLRVIPADGGEPRTLLTEGMPDTGQDCIGRHMPLWTSDGRYVVTILREGVPTQQPESPKACSVFKVPVDGGDPTYLGAIPPQRPPSTWALSPDDSHLAFQTGQDRGEIWILQGLEGR